MENIPMYTNKFTVALNDRKDEFMISFYLDQPEVDLSGKKINGVKTIPVSTIVANGETIKQFCDMITQMLRDEE